MTKTAFDHSRGEWLTSVETRKALRISTCDLAHMREDGAIRAEKRGNAFYYFGKDVDALRKKKIKTGAGFCRIDDLQS